MDIAPFLKARAVEDCAGEVTRARIILMAVDGKPNTAIAEEVGINKNQVGGKPLPSVATGCRSDPMVRRGSAVRVRQRASSRVKRRQIAEGVRRPEQAPIDSVVMCSGGGALAQCKSPILVPSPGQHARTRAQTGRARNDAPAGLSAQATTHEK